MDKTYYDLAVQEHTHCCCVLKTAQAALELQINVYPYDQIGYDSKKAAVDGAEKARKLAFDLTTHIYYA